MRAAAAMQPKASVEEPSGTEGGGFSTFAPETPEAIEMSLPLMISTTTKPGAKFTFAFKARMIPCSTDSGTQIKSAACRQRIVGIGDIENEITGSGKGER